MGYLNPTVQDFKNFFVRDFPYGENLETSVTDQDIAKAMLECGQQINQALFTSQENYNLGFLYFSASNLVNNFSASSQGLSSQYNWVTQSKSVGSVSQSSQIPQKILDNPEYSYFSTNGYGVKYLMMIWPFLVAPVFVVPGRTLA